VIGTDAPGIDRGNPYIARDFAATGDRSLIWEAHRVGVEHEYFQRSSPTWARCHRAAST
jgi:hypothetical protein